MIAVPARVLDFPSIQYAGTQRIQPRSGSWNLQNVKASRGTSLSGGWTYLHIQWEGNYSRLQGNNVLATILAGFQTELCQIGVVAPSSLTGMVKTVRSDNMVSEVDDAIRRFTANKRHPALLLVILPDENNTAIYNSVKYACDVKYGMLNVCVKEGKLAKANAQYYANVGLKVNLKLGGTNHSLEPRKLGIIKEKKTMVVGIDVTHPSPGSSSNAPSVAAIVASVDETLGQWPAELRIQPARQEMVEHLESMFLSRLRRWQKLNKTLPDNIIVYRDGVSEGQYDSVLEKELPALRKAAEQIYPATDTKKGLPKVTIIICGKRHHTRFYATSQGEAHSSGNPENGTVVDRGVTQAWLWDFFLQAHAAIKGTARPCHYYVIYDQIFRARSARSNMEPSAADALEDLTHSMCYLFGRATKAVSLCPPAYYADLACERARCYLSSVFEPSSVGGSTASVADTNTGKADDSLVLIHEDVRDRMFYV